MAKKTWYQTGYDEACQGLPFDAPMQRGHASYKNYKEGYGDGEMHNRIYGQDDVVEEV